MDLGFILHTTSLTNCTVLPLHATHPSPLLKSAHIWPSPLKQADPPSVFSFSGQLLLPSFYFALNALAQYESGWAISFQPRRISSALFIICCCFRPRPPDSLGLQTSSQPTRLTFLFSSVDPHKNFFHCFSISLQIYTGNFTDCISYEGNVLAAGVGP